MLLVIFDFEGEACDEIRYVYTDKPIELGAKILCIEVQRKGMNSANILKGHLPISQLLPRHGAPRLRLLGRSVSPRKFTGLETRYALTITAIPVFPRSTF